MSDNETQFKNEDWWETVFKPKYSIRECREILDISSDTNTDSSLTLPSDEIITFKNVKQVSDSIDKDKNIYRKVWREQKFATNEFSNLKSWLSEGHIYKLDKNKENLSSIDKSTQTKECIWNAKEMKIIRSCIKDFKQKDVKSTAEIKELKYRNEELTSKLQLSENRLQKKRDILHEAIKANERFHILTETLSSQLEESKSRNTFLVNQKVDLATELNKSRLSVESLNKEILDKESEINALQKKLNEIEKKHLRKLEKALLETKREHNAEIDSLQIQLTKISKELCKEKAIYQATEKGFQLLLKHYSGKASETGTVDIKTIKYTNI